jgi:hypothetical protein
MRCYFHLANCHETILDDIGIEVLDLETARVEAQKAINELRRDQDGVTEDWTGWRLDIVDRDDTLLCSLDLSVILH